MWRLNILLVLMLAAAFALPLGASSSKTQPAAAPVFNGGALGGPLYLSPASVVNYQFWVIGKNITVLHISAVLPRQMQILKKGSDPFVVIKGKPTWTIKAVNNYGKLRTRGFKFSVMVKPTAKVGSKYQVILNEKAQTGKWVKLAQVRVNARVVSTKQ